MDTLVSQPTYLVVDLGEVISEYKKLGNWYNLYNKFPLTEIISCILIDGRNGFNEYLWDATVERVYEIPSDQQVDFFGNDTYIKQEDLSNFYEILTWTLDSHIDLYLPYGVSGERYLFEKWVNSTAVLLKWV